MITRLHVRNFKSLENFEVSDIPRLVCLIGVNGAGKTSFIQLLTFIRALVSGQVDKWAIGGKPCETKTLAFAGAQKRNFELMVEFDLLGGGARYQWSITYNLYEGQLVRETLKSMEEERMVLSFESGGLCVGGKDLLLPLSPKGSALSIPFDGQDEIARVRAELAGCAGVGVLDPVAIADAARAAKKGELEIDENGHRLPAFVGRLAVGQREEYVRAILGFYGDFDGVDVKSTQFGWKRIVFTELKKTMDALHMSYGTLRFMVMAALKYSQAHCLYFDEVDNGINQEYLGKVVKLLRSMVDKQVFITTHNVQLLNNFEDDELRNGVLFFYKDDAHRTKVKRFFDIEGMSSALEYDAGGSIVSMTNLVELGQKLCRQDAVA